MLDRVGGSPKALCPRVMVPLLRLTSRSAVPSWHRGRAPHTAQRARPCWAVRDQGPRGHFRRGNDGPVLGTGWGPHSPGESPGPGGAPAGEPSSAREQRATRAPRAVCRAAGVWNFTSTAFNVVRFHSQCLNLRRCHPAPRFLASFGNEDSAAQGLSVRASPLLSWARLRPPISWPAWLQCSL